MRRVIAAAAVLGVALCGVLLPVAALADDDGTDSVIDDPAPDRSVPAADTPHDPPPVDRGHAGPSPTADYAFVPAGVVVDLSPSRGSRVTELELRRAGDGGDPLQRCDRDDEGVHGDGVLECTFSALGPGDWSIHGEQDSGRWRLHWRWDPRDDRPWGHWRWSWHWHRSAGVQSLDAVITVPDAPVIDSARIAPDGSITVTGSGTAGDPVHVADAGGAPVCDVTADGAGAWSCGASGPFAPGSGLTAIAEDARTGTDAGIRHVPGGLSASSAPVAATLAVPPIVVDPAWTFSIGGIDLSSIHPGDAFSVSGSSLPPGLDVLIELHSDPVTLAHTQVGEDGAFAAQAVIPPDTEPGVHRVVVTLSGAGIEPTSKEAVVTIAAPPSPPAAAPPPPVETPAPAVQTIVPAFVAPASPPPAPPAPTVASLPPPVVAAPHAAEPEAEPAEAEPAAESLEPNILTNALEPVTIVFTNPEAVASAFAIGLVLIILAAVPAHLLNATIAEQYQRFSGRFARMRRPQWYARMLAWLGRRTSADAVALIAVTALLLSFADPTFGFNEHSLRLIIACAVALLFVAFISNWVTALILQRRWSVDAVISVRPLGLILTVLGVVASRLLDFSPGFLIGLVLGLSISTTAIKEFAWRAVAIRSAIIIAVAIASWLGFSAMTLHGEPHDFAGALVVEILVALTTEGIVMLLVDLLPFRLLEGERLFVRSRWLWGAYYLVVTVVFVISVAAWEGNWRELGGAIWLWTSTVVVFGLLCVGVYLYFRFWAPPLPEEQVGEEEPLARIE